MKSSAQKIAELLSSDLSKEGILKYQAEVYLAAYEAYIKGKAITTTVEK